MPDADPRIAIIGAGIGGLTAAMHLHAHGFRNITVYESAPRLEPLGVGINVQPHATLVLRDLGLLPALLATGVATRELNYYNRHGDAILSEPRGLAAGYAVPQLSLHRGHLQMLLLEAARERLGERRVRLGHALVSFRRDEDAGVVHVGFGAASGAEGPVTLHAECDLLVAADGINSTVRRLLYPDEGPPKYSGRMLWRGCIEREPFLTGATMVWGGHADQKFVAYPISEAARRRGRSLVNWICEIRTRKADDPDTTPPRTDYLATVPKEIFAPQFDSWEMGGLKVKELVAETERVYEFPMCDRDPIPQWSFGRLTLIGDAAHPMYPIGSNGASQAILDAEALTTALITHTVGRGTDSAKIDIPAALKAYESVRLPPTSKIIMANRGNGPDQVMQLAEERAPEGFRNVHDIIPKEELDQVGHMYKVIAGFEKDTVNARAKETEGQAERLGLRAPKSYLPEDLKQQKRLSSVM